ncbi:hypothetical protein KPH14_006602 [Odynerus spinipes]|uniref:MIF4G domain-containing protein n=1 Tax=Odynerus spinipes TaxID=1348599 RepID=A0AAD9RR23_9HYME|nr:hypothetical protein KPH14_006602 [Odynerus spinipes]
MDRLGGDESGDGDMERRVTGKGRGRGSWMPMSKNTQEHQALRRPHHAGTTYPAVGSIMSKSSEQIKLQESLNNIVENSTLSVDAAEFVPKCQSYAASMQSSSAIWPKHSVQNRIQLARELPNQLPGQMQLQQRQIGEKQYYEHNCDSTHSSQQQLAEQEADKFRMSEAPYEQHAQYTNSQSSERYDTNISNHIDGFQELRLDNQEPSLTSTMQQLVSVMHYLTMNPGSFASLVPPLLNSIKLLCESPTQLQEIVESLIEQSINEGNFRYSGARICMCLDTAMANNEQKTFREILHSLCKEKIQKQASTWQKNEKHTEEEQMKCHGLILFLAELVVQLEDVLAFELGELLIKLITIVLKNPGSNSAKHICQALKLAGHTLERDNRGSRKDMENMMRALTELVTEGRADSNIGRMIDSVHKLRNGNWGHDSHNSSSHKSLPEPMHTTKMQHGYNELVLYGPDGKILSAEESEFLQDAARDDTDVEDQTEIDHEYEEEALEDEDDESFALAYEEFLKLLPKKNESKVHQ